MNLFVSLLTDFFIVFMLFILWAWDLPQGSRLNRLAFKFRWVVERLGLFHGWQLFSPDPKTDNYRLQFKLRLADDSIITIEPEYLRYPDVQRQPVRYRWTKIKSALLRADAISLRTSVCKYAAAEFMAQHAPEAQQSDKRPVEVQIVRWRQPIVPLESKETAGCQPYKQRIIYTQTISLASLVARCSMRD
jgi:hypothetical protein